MENATKGLMIAGAILIAIVIIGIGVFLVAQTRGPVDEAGARLGEMEIRTFNSQYEAHEGKKKGSEVTNLLSIINTNNINAERDRVTAEKGIKVIFENGSEKMTSSEISEIKQQIISGKTYSVLITDYKSNGYVKTITIKSAE